MPFIRDWATSENIADSLQHTGSLPIYNVGDLLLWIVAKDDRAGNNFIDLTSGWSIGDQKGYGATGNNTVQGAWYWKTASSLTEQAPGIRSTDTDAWHSVMISISNYNTASIFNVTTSVSSAGVNPRPIPGVTVTSSSVLMIYGACTDGAVQTGPYPESNMMFIEGQDAGTVGVGCWWTIQKNSGSAATGSYWSLNSTGDETVAFAISVNDSPTAPLTPAYVDRSNLASTLISPFCGVVITMPGDTFPAALSLPQISGNNTGFGTHGRVIDIGFDAGATTADYGLNPYNSALGLTPAISNRPAPNLNMSGTQYTFSAAKNMSSGSLLCSWLAANPRDYLDIGAIPKREGLFLIFADLTNSYKAFEVGANGASPDFRSRMFTSINLNLTGTQWGSSTGTLNTTDIRKIIFAAANPFGAIAYYISQMVMTDKLIIAGGTGSELFGFDGFLSCGKSYILPYMETLGAAGALSYIPVQIGGGDPVFCDINACSLQFPQVASVFSKSLNYHNTTGSIGISYYGKTNDIIKHRNSVISAKSPFYWEIHPSASSGATYDFSGLTVVGAKPVTLRPVFTASQMTFAGCGQVSALSCSLLGCNFVSPLTGANAALLINTSGSLTDCTFTTEDGRDYAIELPITGTYVFSGLTFTGFNKDVYVSVATGVVTMSLTNDSDVPTYNTAGATVVVENTKTLEFTGIVEGSEVRIYQTSDDTELTGTESLVGTTFTYNYNYASDIPIYVVIFSLAYKDVRLTTLSLTSTNQSIPIQQVIDRVYST